jgi:protein-disulfide isomerase
MKRAEADIEKYFANPLKVEIGGSPVKGPADAKVTIFEFSDFECPYCKRGFDVVEEVLKAYPNDVKVVFKNMPLEFHNMATPAAKAALAAQKQGKFWEFHDELFKNQQSISEELFPKIATTLGLDMEKFKADMNSPEVEAQIKSDISIAKALDITGTPGFIVAGIPVKGAYPFEHFKKIIDRSLNGGPAKG